jgi:hypothetical protein
MSIGRYLRRHMAAPTVRRLDMLGEMLVEQHLKQLLSTAPYTEPNRLEPFGFRSFSQNDEDGIIQEIFRRLAVERGTFVEFGVQDGMQNNSRLLLYKQWKGLWIEADAKCIQEIQRAFAAELKSGQLKVLHSFVTRENITELIASAGLGEIDLLSIDIDGNDYWIWQAIGLRPKVVIMEYNAKFRPPVEWVMTYNPEHRWDYTDYQGASLTSLDNLARQKGYVLVGTCMAGVNAFFVRDDLVAGQFAKADVASLFNPPRYYFQHLLSPGHPTSKNGPYESI